MNTKVEEEGMPFLSLKFIFKNVNDSYLVFMLIYHYILIELLFNYGVLEFIIE
jgi:hypothetical protein